MHAAFQSRMALCLGLGDARNVDIWALQPQGGVNWLYQLDHLKSLWLAALKDGRVVTKGVPGL